MPVGEEDWAAHAAQWRDPAQIVSQWESAAIDSALMRYRIRGSFEQTLEELGVTLIVTREYEHLLMALSVHEGRLHMTYVPLPHPSGIAIDRGADTVAIASTRNPNQVFRFAPATRGLNRRDAAASVLDRPLLPFASTFYPGSLYIHDLAYIDNRLYANAVAHNAVVELRDDGHWRRVWWPKAIERDGDPDFGRNYLQLNSIAAGASISSSYFSASAERMSARRPGHLNFTVDGRGVILSGKTREPVVRGLTRPHSVRFRAEELWVANSGYGELVRADDGRPQVVSRLPGWTRGLCVCGDTAFVGTSRVIPRFRAYAPGLDVGKSVCGVHAIDLRSGQTLGSFVWPGGNQIFAVEWIARSVTFGFPFGPSLRRGATARRLLFYAYDTDKRAKWETENE